MTHAHLQQIRRNLAHQQRDITVRAICMKGPLMAFVISFNLCACALRFIQIFYFIYLFIFCCPDLLDAQTLLSIFSS